MHKLRFLGLLLISIDASGHGNFSPPADPVLAASVMAGYTASNVESDTLWRIPGVQMGGETFGPEQGFQLHEATLGLDYANDDNVLGSAEISSHGHGGSNDLQLEQAFAGWFLESGEHALRLEAGKMKALFAPQNARHASAESFSQKPLVYDAFLGGHFTDTGARIRWQWRHDETRQLDAGIEVWRGDAFPATSGEDARNLDAYLRYRIHGRVWDVLFGGWYLHSQARNRSDDRLTSGHDHGGVTSVSDDVVFNGQTGTGGLHGEFDYALGPKSRITVSAEYWSVSSEGEVRDTTRLIALDGDYAGYALQGAISRGAHALALRYDQLILDNYVQGNGAELLAADAGLVSAESNPDRYTVSHNWTLAQGLSLRTELIRDRTTARLNTYGSLFLVWRQNFALY